MGFPVTTKYFLRFRHSDTGLTPLFSLCKRADTMADVTAPSIAEVGNGTYYFNWTFTTATDPDLVFEVDGGASIPTEEVRYIGDTISAKGFYLDEPVSQVKDDIWNDATVRAAGTKGRRLDQAGDPADTGTAATLFGRTVAIEEMLGTLTTQVMSLPAPDNAKISDIWMKTEAMPDDTAAALTSLSTLLTRALGMLHENSVLDRCTFNSSNSLLSARLRTYSTKADADNALAALPSEYTTHQIGEYVIQATYENGNLSTYVVTRTIPA